MATKLSALAALNAAPKYIYGIDGSNNSGKINYDIINVKDFGAAGDSTGDDGPEIQAAFDAAFGTAGSPHGNANSSLNRPVYFPAGVYNVGNPLYLTGVDGGHIFGSGSNSTILNYTGSPTAGNSVVANGITPLIFFNGWRYSSMENMGFTMPSNAATVCLYLFSNNSPLGDRNQNQCVWSNLCTDTSGTGIIIGYQTLNGLCSENTFIGCSASQHILQGFRNIDSNALNNNFYNCGASHCGVGFSAPTGQIAINGCSLAANTIDIEAGQNPMYVAYARSESANFFNATGSSASPHYLVACIQDGNHDGYFADVGSCRVIFDACASTNTGAAQGLIQGSGTVCIRNCRINNTSFLSNFLGTVMEWNDYPSTVANLPTGAAYLRGVRRFVTDAVTATFGASATGGGSNKVPVFYDGTAWKIG